MASSAKTTTVILDKPSDWHEWLFVIRNRALDTGIKHLIDPDLATEPPQLTEPTKPTPKDVKFEALGLTDLNSAQIELFKILRDEYRIELVKYERKRVALTEIRQLIISTVTRTNLTYILDSTTPYQMLTALKLRIAPTDRARELEATRQYRELQNAPNSQSTDVWLQRWEKMYTEAKKLDLPDVQKDRAIYDFLRTIKFIDSAFANIHEILLDEKITENKPIPTIFDLISKFRNHLRLNQETTRSYTHTAFATLNGKAQKEPWTRECVCGEIHRFSDCLYLIEALRPSEWTVNDEIQKKIDTKLAKNDWLRDRVEDAQNYVRKRIQFKKKEAPKEAPKDAPKEASKETSKEAPRETSMNVLAAF